MEQKTKSEIIQNAIEAREQEVLLYQINIDNYELALEEIHSLPELEKVDLDSFVAQLEELLKSEKLEQKKAKIMLKVLKQQAL